MTDHKELRARTACRFAEKMMKVVVNAQKNKGGLSTVHGNKVQLDPTVLAIMERRVADGIAAARAELLAQFGAAGPRGGGGGEGMSEAEKEELEELRRLVAGMGAGSNGVAVRVRNAFSHSHCMVGLANPLAVLWTQPSSCRCLVLLVYRVAACLCVIVQGLWCWKPSVVCRRANRQALSSRRWRSYGCNCKRQSSGQRASRRHTEVQGRAGCAYFPLRAVHRTWPRVCIVSSIVDCGR
jgi:hypothetical protein